MVEQMMVEQREVDMEEFMRGSLYQAIILKNRVMNYISHEYINVLIPLSTHKPAMQQEIRVAVEIEPNGRPTQMFSCITPGI